MLEGDTQLSPDGRRANMLDFYWKFLCLTRLEIPTIAMINGHAIGAGMMMALACDLRIMSRQAKLGAGFIRIGLSPGMGATHLLPRLLGMPKALELLWTSRIIDAEESLGLGLVNQVVDAEELRAVTSKLAVQLAKGPPIPMKLLKRAIYRQAEAELPRALEYEALCQSIALQTEDYGEGLKAMGEKREPEFRGR